MPAPKKAIPSLRASRFTLAFGREVTLRCCRLPGAAPQADILRAFSAYSYASSPLRQSMKKSLRAVSGASVRANPGRANPGKSGQIRANPGQTGRYRVIFKTTPLHPISSRLLLGLDHRKPQMITMASCSRKLLCGMQYHQPSAINRAINEEA